MKIRVRDPFVVVAAVTAAVILNGAVASAYGSAPEASVGSSQAAAAPESETPETVPLDVTGEAASSEERDRLYALLAPLQEANGGYIFDRDTQSLTIQMTSDAALAQSQQIVAGSGTSLLINFVRVEYAEQEMNALAEQLLQHQLEWAGTTGIGGGYDPVTNRVLMQVSPEYSSASTLIAAIENLNDPRLTLQVLESVVPEEDVAESRVDDAAPGKAGADI